VEKRVNSGFRALAVVTALVSYLEIVLGGTVRITGSGEACPDWPTCHGQLIPQLSGHVLIEYSHRLAASLVSILVVLLVVAAIWVWRQPRYLKTLSIIAVGLLVLQVILGGITVLANLPPPIVAAHLAIATLLLGLLTTIAVYAFTGRAGRPSLAARRFSRAVMFAASATFLLILSGSYVVGSNASLGCYTWPLCNGQLIPMGGQAGVDIAFLHRLIALVTGIAVIGVAVMAGRIRSSRPIIFWSAVAALIVYAAQVLLGAGNVWTGLSQGVRIAHLAAAQALWALTAGLSVLAAVIYDSSEPAQAVATRRRLPDAPSPNRRPRFGDRVRATDETAGRDDS
jgi:heme A synthase